MIRSIIKRLLPSRVWLRLHEWKVGRLIRDYPHRVVEHLYHGFPLKVLIADGLASAWYDHDWSAQTEIEFLKKHRLRTGARVFDCGAHQGVVAMMLARVVGSTGEVIAVEATQHNCEVARENFKLNAITHARCLHAGVSNASGTLRFSFSLNATACPTSGSVSVEAITIDQLTDAHGPPDVLIVDVEGFELNVLHGAARTLATRPSCMIEVHVNHGLEAAGGSSIEVINLLRSAGYKLHVFRENDPTVFPLEQAPATILQDRFFLLAV